MRTCTLALLISMIALPTTATEKSDDAVIPGVTRHSIQSHVLGQERELFVALPGTYDTSEDDYPVVYVLDADWHFLTALTASRFLSETSYISAKRMPPVIIVGIRSIDRNHDLTPTASPSQRGMSFPTSGGADAFLTFLEDELIPDIDRRYRTQPYRVLCGWSLGGLFAIYALLERPETFGAYIAISPSLWWDEELFVTRAIELARTHRMRERDLVLTIGTSEEGGLCSNAVQSLVTGWEATPLEGLSLSFIEIPDADHNHSPYKAYFDALRSLFADWFYPEEAFASGLESLQAHYATLSRRRGYDIEIPDHLYQALARQYLSERRFDDAVTVMETQCDRKPDSAILHYELGEVCRKAHDADRARQAYQRALALERGLAMPDTVFIQWVEGVLAGMDSGG
jgi:predicted alpha/beta superfamily hydrolase